MTNAPGRRPIALALMLLLGGCYSPLTLPEPERALLLGSEHLVRASLGPRAGAKVPLTEDDLLNIAMETSPLLASSQARVEVAQASVAEAGMWPGGQVRLSDLGWEEGGTTLARFQVAYRQYLPHLVEHGALVDAAQAGVQEADAAGLESRWALRLQVRQAHAAALHAHDRLLLASEIVRLRRDIVDQQNIAVEKGLSGLADQAGRELDLMEALAEEARWRGEEARALKTLAHLVGLPSPPQALAEKELICPHPPMGRGMHEERIQRNHPALRRLRAAHEVAEARLRAEYGRRIPWLDYIQGGYEYDPKDNRSAFGISLAIDIPLFSWNGGAIQRGQAERREAWEAYREGLWVVLGTYRESRGRWEQSHTLMIQLEDRIGSACERLLSVTEEGMSRGITTRLLGLEVKEKCVERKVSLSKVKLECREAYLLTEHSASLP